MTKKAKAIIYARVSSDKQYEDSIERQADLCRKLAKREGLTVAAAARERQPQGRCQEAVCGLPETN